MLASVDHDETYSPRSAFLFVSRWCTTAAAHGPRRRLPVCVIRRTAFVWLILVAVGAFAGVATAQDWPTYLHDPGRSSASGEGAISTRNAASLTKRWAFKTHGGVAASPIVAKGVVFVGSWDGYEYALDAATGALKWKTFIGVTKGHSKCVPSRAGVSSSATVRNGTVYVGGGNSYWYALNAKTGKVRWRLFTGNNSAARGHYNWASPLIYKRSAYVGIASLGDCPLVRGRLLRVDLATGRVVAAFNAVPRGEVGGGIWTSPTLDPATNTVYVTTGSNGAHGRQPYALAIVALNATTLAVKGSWRVPPTRQIPDGDWGNTPTLISHRLVVATNKNGILYAFKRSNVSAGPVWQHRVAAGGPCPLCGDGSVSSSAFGGGRVYAAGANGRSGGIAFPGTLSAFNPGNGKVIWRVGQAGAVIPALAYVNGLLLAGVGPDFKVFDARTGRELFAYATANLIFSPPTVSGGRIYVGSQDENVYAFAVGAARPPANTARVNAGGGTYVDSGGRTWAPDCCYSGGSVYSNNVSIAGTSDPALYRSQRWSTTPFSYTFSNLASGQYHVTLKFAEIAYIGPGRRLFNVSINGTQVLTNFDVAGQVGFNRALDETFTASPNSSGQITITFAGAATGSADNPMVSAIQIVPG
jgi:outer membrane protein assembly factor BamB